MSMRRVLLGALLSGLLFNCSLAQVPSGNSSRPGRAAPADLYRALPLSFEPNQGQVVAPVEFVSRAGGYTVFLAGPDLIVVPSSKDSRTAVRIRLLGANPSPKVAGQELLPSKSNYYIGARSNWHTGIPQYRKVGAGQVYPGIDVVYYGNQRQLEYDFAVKPGADPGNIRLAVDGVSRPTMDADGNVELNIGARTLLLRRPVAYQVIGAERKTVAAKYALRHDGIAISLGRYDTRQPLIIDPVLSYATYLGGSGLDTANAVAVDGAGNAYVTGQTCSPDFPSATPATYRGNCDAYVTAVAADGSTIRYSTYLGGTNGDNAKAVVVDAAGIVTVVGTTNSPDYPVQGTAFQPSYGGGDTDAFVSRLDATGVLIYSSFLGGSHNEDGNGVTLDHAGNIIVDGQTGSLDFPTVPLGSTSLVPLYNAFITKLSVSGGFSTAAFSRYLSVPSDAAITCDTANAVAVDLLDDIYIAGTTIQDCEVPDKRKWFVAKFTASGSGVDCPLADLGCRKEVYGWVDAQQPSMGLGIAVDSLGNALLAGNSKDGALVVKVNPQGSDIPFANTYPAPSSANAIAVDGNGVIYVAGTTSNPSFPVLSATQPLLAGGDDAFVLKLHPSGSALIFSTFFGGTASDFGSGIALGGSGGIYVAGSSGSLDLPVTNALQSASAGTGDGFLAKWTGANLPYASLDPDRINFGNQAVGTTSSIHEVSLTNLGDAPLEITGIDITGEFSQTHDCGVSVAVGAHCTIKILFTPTTAGGRTGTLTVTDNASGSPQTVELTGDGTVGMLTASPSSLTYADQAVSTTSTLQTVTINNAGSDVITLTGIAVSGDFSVQNRDCAATLAGGGFCRLDVTFTPTELGLRSGALTVHYTPSGVALTIPLSGNGTAGPVSITPSSLLFENPNNPEGWPVTMTSTPKTIAITNNTTAAITLGGIATEGDFAVQGKTCAASLGAGSACTVTLTFTPTAIGPRAGTLTINDSAPGSPRTVPLTGNGIEVVMAAVTAETPNNTLSFGNQQISTTSAAKVVTITNTDQAVTVTMGAIAASGDFSTPSSTCGAALLPLHTCTVQVVFTPASLGPRSGTLTINDSATNSPQIIVLAGNGTSSSGGGGGGAANADFALSVTPPSSIVSAGTPATHDVTATPLGGLDKTVTFTCSGLPTTFKCSFSPSSVTLDGQNAAKSMVTISTEARAALDPGPFGRSAFLAAVLAQLSFGVLGIVAIAGKRNSSRRKGMLPAGILILLVLMIPLTSCGTGSSNSNGNGSGTQPGTYTITITGSSTGSGSVVLTHTAAVSVTVK